LYSCGIEDYPFLTPVPEETITRTLNERADIPLPSIDSSDIYFKNFSFFYRLYVSNVLQSGEITRDQNTLKNINTTLSSDYFAIEPYTKIDNNMATGVGSLFSGRKYYQLLTEGSEIENLLSIRNSAIVSITFQRSLADPYPRLLRGSDSYNLIRSNGNGLFRPQPEDRYFLNTKDLNAKENLTTEVNADVVDAAEQAGDRYVYCAMYIVATGFDTRSLSPIYSSPAFVSIFLLPDQE
jgi:hypothetical protein